MRACTTASSPLLSLSSTTRKSVESYLNTRWYGQPGSLGLLQPFEWLFSFFADRRRARALACSAIPKDEHLPTIVVGNIVAGGTGKTPVVGCVIDALLALGARPGIVTRGYGGTAAAWPRLVSPLSDPAQCGDEAVELARATGCPVVAGPDRPAAIRWLAQFLGCNVAVSDDGLQHYPMARDLEIVVVDALRQFGNGHRLPVGPLREPVSRLQQADLVLMTARTVIEAESAKQQILQQVSSMKLEPGTKTRPLVLGCTLSPCSALPLFGEHSMPVERAPFVGQRCIALSGIGAPERFHADLAALGCDVRPHALADHDNYQDLISTGALQHWASEGWVVTTAKDAVKLRIRLGGLPRSGADGTILSAPWHNRIWVMERQVDLLAEDDSCWARTLASFVARWQLTVQPAEVSEGSLSDREIES